MPDNKGNASKPDASDYIENLRRMDADGRLAELANVRQKLHGANLVNVHDLIEYYGEVFAWLSLIVSFEMNEAIAERPDIYGFCPPPNYTTDIA